MDREQAKVITEYDHLFSTQMGLLLPWIGRLFGLGACRRQQDVRRRGKKDQLELHKSVERENRKDEDMLSCVVMYSADNTFLPVLPLRFSLQPRLRDSRDVVSGVLHGPSLQPADRPVDVVNQPKTRYRETGCASKKCWYIDSSSPPAISTLPDAGHARAHIQSSWHWDKLKKKILSRKKGMCAARRSIWRSHVRTGIRENLNLLLSAISPNFKDQICLETAVIIKYELI